MTKKKKTATYNMTWKQIEDIKQKAIDETVRRVSREAFDRTVILSLLVLRDHWGFGEIRL